MKSRLLAVGAALLVGVPSAAAPAGVAPGDPADRDLTAATSVEYGSPSGAAPIVVRTFDLSAGPYGPGHRGVDLDLSSNLVIRSAAQGVVTYVGRVAGRGVIVVLHPDGLRTEYEPIDSTVHRGDRVSAGEVIGRIDGAHPGCPVPHCLHWSARRGAEYLDPMTLLALPLGPVRLLPLSNTVRLLPAGQARGWARR